MRTSTIACWTAWLATVAACSSARGGGLPDPNAVTFCIENTAIGYGNVVAYVGSSRFTVHPGEEVCKDVRAVGVELSVRAGTTSGGSMGPLRFAFGLPASPGCWHWRVTSSPTLDVVPCDEE